MSAQLAQLIIERAKNDHSILCWDGSNAREDVLENIRNYVHEFTSWKYLSVTFENDVLEIWGRSEEDVREEPISYDGYWIMEKKDYTRTCFILSYNVRTNRELYGRLRHAGFYYPHIEELKVLLH